MGKMFQVLTEVGDVEVFMIKHFGQVWKVANGLQVTKIWVARSLEVLSF